MKHSRTFFVFAPEVEEEEDLLIPGTPPKGLGKYGQGYTVVAKNSDACPTREYKKSAGAGVPCPFYRHH